MAYTNKALEVIPDESLPPGVPVQPDQPVASQPLIPPGVGMPPEIPVSSQPLSQQDLIRLAFNRQLQDPSAYGRLPGSRPIEDLNPNPPPPGTGYTYSTRLGPNGELINSPVTHINAPGRAPIQPPQGGGMPVPDLSGLMGAAFQHLPIDQAEKAIEMATRFVGQRGYQRDLQSGLSAEQAFAKWAPMLFHSSPSGMATALRGATPPQITPYQKAELAGRQAQNQISNAFREREVKAREQSGGAASPIGKLQKDRATALAKGDTEAVSQIDEAIIKATAPKDLTPGETMRLKISAHNLMNRRSGERPTDPSYQSRTNFAKALLKELDSRPDNKPEIRKRARAAISSGADEAKVKARYKEVTGEDLDTSDNTDDEE